MHLILRKTPPIGLRTFATKCTWPPIDPIVTILDASSLVGSNLSILLKQNPNISELRLYDENKKVDDIADDLNTIDTTVQVTSFPRTSLKEAICDAKVVISAGGCPTKAGYSQEKLFEKNADNIRNVAMFLAAFNPHAIYCMTAPPVEALVPMVSEEYKKANTYDYRKVIGVTSFASMVTSRLIAQQMGTDPSRILCPLVGGFSPHGTIPVMSQSKPAVSLNTTAYRKLTKAIANEEETVLKKGGTICHAKAISISRFVNAVLKALKGDANCVECGFVAQVGHMGDFLPFMTSIIKLGPEGIQSTHMPKVNDAEVAQLRGAMPLIIENIVRGKSFVGGDLSDLLKFKKKARCEQVIKEKMARQAQAKKKQEKAAN